MFNSGEYFMYLRHTITITVKNLLSLYFTLLLLQLQVQIFFFEQTLQLLQSVICLR